MRNPPPHEAAARKWLGSLDHGKQLRERACRRASAVVAPLVLTAVLLIGPSPTPAQAPPASSPAEASGSPQAAAPAPSQPSPPGPSQAAVNQANAELILTLLRTTLVALHQANTTGNYTVLRDLGSPGFRDKNSAGDLVGIFTSVRQLRIDLAAAVILEPQLTRAAVEKGNVLHLAGQLATKPVPISFELLYVPVAGTWRFDAISIAPAQPSQAAAPGPPSAPAPAVAVNPSGPNPAVKAPAPAAKRPQPRPKVDRGPRPEPSASPEKNE
jgi:hypothetical protein